MAPFFMLESFLEYLRNEKRASEHTVTAYRNDLTQYLNEFGISETEIDNSTLRHWVVEMHDQGLANRTINRKLSSVRSYHNWLRKTDVVKNEKTLKVKGPKLNKRLPQFVRQKDLLHETRLIHSDMDHEEARDILMVELFYQTGIRLSELIELKQTSIQFDSIKVVGKRKKERIIPISNDLFKMIGTYQEIKKNLGFKSEYLLTKKDGNKLYPKLVYRKINTYLGEVAELEKKSPHVLRHTFATHMLNNGAGLETIKDLLGHASLSATQVYTHNSFTQLSSIYSQAHPRGRKTG